MAVYFISFVALLFFFPKFTLWVVVPALILVFILGVLVRFYGLFTAVKGIFSRKPNAEAGAKAKDGEQAAMPKATSSPENAKVFDDTEGLEDDEAFMARQRAMND